MSNNNSDFLKGALIGGLLGGVAAFLTATKTGNELRKQVMDGCSNLKSNGYSLSDIKSKLLHVLDNDDEDEDEDEDEEDEENGEHHPFLIGSALGAVIAGLAALLLAPQSGEKLRASLGDRYDDIREKAEDFIEGVNKKGHRVAEGLDDWKDFFSTIVKRLSHAANKKEWHIDEILDYANMGLRLFQHLKKSKEPVKKKKKRVAAKASRAR